MRVLIGSMLGVALLAVGASAEVYTVPGTPAGYPLPPGFQIRADGVTHDKGNVYIWVDGEGNCRYEYKQECYPGQNGQMICHMVPVWTCDRATAWYKLPGFVTVDEGAKRAYAEVGPGAKLTIGETKQFLWNKWIKLFDGADTQVSYQGAALVLDSAKLQGSLRRANFVEIYPDASTD